MPPRFAPGSLLERLGLGTKDRAVIFHADDVGLCQATVDAFADLVDFGLLTSGSVMVPCPAFPEAAAFCRRADADEVDLGVHLTLSSGEPACRWRPVSAPDAASGLVSEEGFLHPSGETVQQQADPAAVAIEIQAQLARALASGVDVTHLDSHMAVLFHPRFLDPYLELARAHRMPALLLRPDGPPSERMGGQAALFRAPPGLARRGIPLLDHLYQAPIDQPEDRLERVKAALDALPAGITYFIVHPATDTPELRAMTSDWRGRVADYRVFTSEALRTHVRRCGLHVLGYRALRELMRADLDLAGPGA